MHTDIKPKKENKFADVSNIICNLVTITICGGNTYKCMQGPTCVANYYYDNELA